MATSKFHQLLERKKKLEQELEKEMEKRLLQIGRLAKSANLMEWSDEALKSLFSEAKERTESDFLTDRKLSENPSD